MTDAASARTSPSGTTPATSPVLHRSLLGNLLRGALIGTVETVPGVSGGTVALVTGIYDELIDSAHHLTGAARRLLTGPDRRRSAGEHLRAVSWRLLIPLMIGMAAAVLLLAGPVSRLVEAHPETMRALFLGLVLGSVLVPMRLSGGSWRIPEWLRFGAGAAAGLAVTSLPNTSLHPSPWVVVPAAAIAICALVLPGMSGSFILLSLGLYQPTLQAIDERDLGYIAVFGLGACSGLVVVVRLMRHLLTRYHRSTMVVLSGVMVGALRSLWPWQSDAGALRAPGDAWLPLLGLAVLGLIAVQLLVLVESRRTGRAPVRTDTTSG
jgi:putative membrane protein